MKRNDFNKESFYLIYLLKSVNEMYSQKQIGKTIIQKLMYLLKRKGLGDYNYTLYHYGPYSTVISEYLTKLSKEGLVKIEWKDNMGYFISPSKKVQDIKLDLNKKDKETIETIVKEYGKNNANELSVIATTFYLMDNFDVPESKIVDEVHQLKPTHTKPQIKSILEKSGLNNLVLSS